MIAMWEIKGVVGSRAEAQASGAPPVPREFLVAQLRGRDRRRCWRRCAASGRRASAIYDVYAPYPVHGLDEAMGLRRSRLPWVTLLAGSAGSRSRWRSSSTRGASTGRSTSAASRDNSTLAFVPICFELTVLFAGLATAGAFLLRAAPVPRAREARIFAEGVTDDMFAVVLRTPRRDLRRRRGPAAAPGDAAPTRWHKRWRWAP